MRKKKTNFLTEKVDEETIMLMMARSLDAELSSWSPDAELQSWSFDAELPSWRPEAKLHPSCVNSKRQNAKLCLSCVMSKRPNVELYDDKEIKGQVVFEWKIKFEHKDNLI